MHFAKNRWQTIALRADSIGAWFSLLSFPNDTLANCLLVSPVLNMEQLISDMMTWASVSEEALRQQGLIPTNFGETLSWQYLTFAREYPIRQWDAPTAILYGEKDPLTRRQTVEAFAARFSCAMTEMKNGEHWFHTPEQLVFLDEWTQSLLSSSPSQG